MTSAIKIENHALIINGIQAQELPQLAQPAVVRVWSVPAEYRDSGYFVGIQQAGLPPEIPGCADIEAELVATLDLPAHDSALASQARAERLVQLNEDADALLSQLDESYPDREVLTWDQQVKEADALQDSPDAVTPLLASLAQYRGVDLELLALKVLEKSALYKVASGQIMGARQWVEQSLQAAQTHEEVIEVPTIRHRLAAIQGGL